MDRRVAFDQLDRNCGNPFRGTLIARLALCIAFVTLGPRTIGAADLGWDISPYQVQVWLALEPVPELTTGWRNGIEREIKRVVELSCGSSWNLQVQDAPHAIRRMMLDRYEAVDIEQIRSVHAEVMQSDKLFLVAVSTDESGYRFQVREFDPRCQYFGSILVRNVAQPYELGTTLAEAILESFSPIGIIERVRDNQALIRMRAGLLAAQDETPLSLAEGQIMRPVLRKSDRLGQPLPNGLEHVPWTLLRVLTRRADGLECEIISGLATPLRARSSRRVERLAIAVKPTYQRTTIRLRSAQEPNKALVGYELHARLPGEKSSTFVGRSDWQGEVTVERDEHPIKVLYVRSGGRLIARLPVATGYEAAVEARVPDDQLRLEAEGFLRGMQEELVDLVARRTVLAVRIRLRLEEQEIDEAQKLFDQLQALPTRDELDRRLRARRQMMTSKDRRMQTKMDEMFRQTQEMLQKHLGNAEIESLRMEISAATREKEATE